MDQVTNNGIQTVVTDELGNLLRLIRDLPEGAVEATEQDTELGSGVVDLLAVVGPDRSRRGIETTIAEWEHRVKRPGGLIVIGGYEDPEYPDFTDAINEWLRRRSEFWQVAQIVGHQIVVRARGRR